MTSDLPDDRCGFTLEPSKVTDEGVIGGKEAWYEDKRVTSCWREVWKDGRCIWHADVENKPIDELKDSLDNETKSLHGAVLRHIDLNDQLSFSGVRLIGADLERSELRDADFTGADLRFANLAYTHFNNAEMVGTNFTRAHLEHTFFWGATLNKAIFRFANHGLIDSPETEFWQAELQNAYLNRSKFSESNFQGADLSEAEMPHANFQGTDFSTADLPSADLKDADLSNADFSNVVLSGTDMTDVTISDTVFHGADLSKADFFGLDLSRIEIDQGTSFGTTLLYEDQAKDAEGSDEKAGQWNKDARSHHDLKIMFAENGFSAKARRHYIAQRRARRKEAAAAGDYYTAFASWISWQGTGYGTSIRRVSRNIAAVLLLSTGIYPFLDVGTHNLWIYTPISELIPRFIEAIPESVYFSIITFTTVGFGTIPPSSELARYFSGIEAFLGTLLMVLLGFVLGNREF
ncbi:pentapeptide repeat-containing protein [Halobellus rufus]|uniref:pentapeptide repeat-containing protein n=1 Tax=Halobellus rufus TaxID=1448860 RepID=UPI0009DE07C2|nr:pentapeptide repeat-containing protein [Halobellus rufus]